ncbi:hypothetical protein SmJEL517_g03280 [Synchytrium microbalum]|uniref:EF-hand domain-containing protein n=1 Tax=Synchytrium microbalum TaxID=1806994 RepID=A0A507C2R6_9FUNG|nr:uncharacterized protein SmJEL517_g03280 [Synchytrium microbalum]TPX34022.1 hypothetical protein SmJEL517_g03280 [Synchytrium microbalum]
MIIKPALTITFEEEELPISSSHFDVSSGLKSRNQSAINDDKSVSVATGGLAVNQEKFRLSSVLKSSLNEKEVDELREIFRLVDQDGGGTISKDELQILMKTLGIRASAAELDAMVDEIDKEKTGEIDFPSFVSAMSREVQTSVSEDELRKAFKLFDHHFGGKPGHITYPQLMSILCHYGGKSRFSNDDAAYILSQILPSLSQTGSLEYNGFIEIYKEAWENASATSTANVKK